MHDLKKDPSIQILLKKSRPPTLDEIVKIAKEKKIKEPRHLWELFDEIHALYKEEHSY